MGCNRSLPLQGQHEGSLLAWARGKHGKWVIDETGVLRAWAVDPSGAPHHAVAAAILDVESWLADGVIEPDGRWEATARRPDVDVGVLMSSVREAAVSAGLLGPFS